MMDIVLLRVRRHHLSPYPGPYMVNISLGTLPIRPDLEVPWRTRDTHLGDRSRQAITTRGLGNLAAMGAWLLQEMGYNVAYLVGRMRAWKDAGLPAD